MNRNKIKIGWKDREVTHKDYAEIVAHRLCVNINKAEKALRKLSGIPQEAFSKLVNMGEENALKYIIWMVD